MGPFKTYGTAFLYPAFDAHQDEVSAAVAGAVVEGDKKIWLLKLNLLMLYWLAVQGFM